LAKERETNLSLLLKIFSLFIRHELFTHGSIKHLENVISRRSKRKRPLKTRYPFLKFMEAAGIEPIIGDDWKLSNGTMEP